MEESARQETHLVAEMKALERSLQRSTDSLQQEEDRNLRLDKRLKKAAKDQQENQISLEKEKQKNGDLLSEQQTLVKELQALRAAVTGAEAERDALGRALKDSNDTHENEKSQLVKKLILEEQQDKPHQQVRITPLFSLINSPICAFDFIL